jgi:hypothetical protein
VPGKDWDRHLSDAEELSCTCASAELRGKIFARAKPRAEDRAVDIGIGTGLLAAARGNGGLRLRLISQRR